jgi:hypothetical protein
MHFKYCERLNYERINGFKLINFVIRSDIFLIYSDLYIDDFLFFFSFKTPNIASNYL